STFDFSIPYSSSSSASRFHAAGMKGSVLPPGVQAKGLRKVSPSAARPALLGIQLSPRFDMRPAARPRYLPFFSSPFQHFRFHLPPPLSLPNSN
ncbi:MAG: hypothetical protein WEB53_16590, partial [Akkermansiaceae bacterium]